MEQEPELFHSGPRKQFSSPPSPAEIAVSFPHLEVLELIGCGGTGAVYKARQKTLDRLVALKVLSTDFAQNDAFVSRFRREAKALAALSHPNIVAVYDAGYAGPSMYLLMEYVNGGNLRTCIREHRLGAKESLAVVIKICSALQVAHDSGVVHRDIKPENILLDSHGNVKIADFGLVKVLGTNPVSTLTRATQVMGTPQYMAPEQYETPADVDHRADLYALGVVLYELLTGELPLGRFEVPSSRAAVDARLDKVVLRALEKDRGRRYQRADEIQTDVAEIASAASARVTAPALTRMPVQAPAPPRMPAPDPVRRGLLPLAGGGGSRRVTLVQIGRDRDGVARALQEISGCNRSTANAAIRRLPLLVAVQMDDKLAQWIRARLEAFGGEAEIQ